MQIINHIHTKQEKFKYIVLNDYTFQEEFIQKPLSSIYIYIWNEHEFFSKISENLQDSYTNTGQILYIFIYTHMISHKT